MKQLFLFFSFIVATAVAQPTADCSGLLKLSDRVYFSDPDSSYHLAQQAELLAEQQQNKAALAEAKWQIGRYLLLKSDLEEANRQLNTSIAIYKELDDKTGIAQGLKIKSILLKRIGNKAEALSSLATAIDLFRDAKDTTHLIGALLNISLDYIDAKQLGKATTALNEAKAITGEDPKNNYFLFQNTGLVALAEGNYEDALAKFDEAKEVALKNNMIDSHATVLKWIGKTRGLKKEFAQAETALMQSSVIAKQNKLDNELLEAQDELITVYAAEEKYEKAFLLLKEQNALQTKILGVERINRISALEKKLALSEKQKEVEAARMNTQRLLYVVFGIVSLLLFSLFLFYRTSKLKNKIAHQHQKLEEKNLVIEIKNKDITDSIHYAKRIQQGILPDADRIRNALPQHFIYYQPKDIVSGDFYWFEQLAGKIFIGAIDCTGHGVPGAFMSILASGLLSKAVKEAKIDHPAGILDDVKKELTEKLKKKNEDFSIKDGMDAGILAIDLQQQTALFSGAFNPLWLIRKQELIEYKGDKIAIGIDNGQTNRPFSNQTISLQPGDQLYLLTDGYADQFGGTHGKKFKYKQLKELLVAIAELPMAEQRNQLESRLMSWKGELEQVDDILLIGIRI